MLLDLLWCMTFELVIISNILWMFNLHEDLVIISNNLWMVNLHEVIISMDMIWSTRIYGGVTSSVQVTRTYLFDWTDGSGVRVGRCLRLTLYIFCKPNKRHPTVNSFSIQNLFMWDNQNTLSFVKHNFLLTFPTIHYEWQKVKVKGFLSKRRRNLKH